MTLARVDLQPTPRVPKTGRFHHPPLNTLHGRGGRGRARPRHPGSNQFRQEAAGTTRDGYACAAASCAGSATTTASRMMVGELWWARSAGLTGHGRLPSSASMHPSSTSSNVTTAGGGWCGGGREACVGGRECGGWCGSGSGSGCGCGGEARGSALAFLSLGAARAAAESSPSQRATSARERCGGAGAGAVKGANGARRGRSGHRTDPRICAAVRPRFEARGARSACRAGRRSTCRWCRRSCPAAASRSWRTSRRVRWRRRPAGECTV